jgi:hypothetical protein
VLTGRINDNNKDEILRGSRTHLKRVRRKIGSGVEEVVEEEEEEEEESPNRKVFFQLRQLSCVFHNQYNIFIDFQENTNFY